jgi:hypothetical protein
MTGKKFARFLTIISSIVLLVSLFGTAGIVVMAEDGEEDEETTYYDENGENLTDPWNADECYNAEGELVPCPEMPEDKEEDGSGNATRIPPGQLVRGGVSGPIVGIGDGYVLIETNFGVVQIYTDEEVVESMIGQRVAIKLAKTAGGASGYARGDEEEDTEEGDDTSGDDTGGGDENGDSEYYRVATAEQFKLIPGKGTKKHSWGTVESTEEGCFFVDEDGNEIPIECGDTDEDVVGLIGGGDDENGGTDENGGSPVLLGTEQTSKIQERIEKRLEQAEEEGDEKTLQRLQQQLERYEEKQLERQEKKAEREAARAEKAQGKKDKDENKGNSQGDKGGGKDKD